MANKTLVQKLNEVSKDIGYLQKDKKNRMQNYSYLSEAKIKEAVKKAFVKHGVIFNYSTDEIREYEISPTSKGTKQFCTIAKGEYRFMDIDSEQQVSGTWFGSGTDTGDKGLYKAITGGIKYVLNTNFLIPSGEDPENDDDRNGDKEPGNGGSGKKETPKLKNGKVWDIDGKKYKEGAIKTLMLKKHDNKTKDAENEWHMFESLPDDDQKAYILEIFEEVKSE